MKILHVWDVAGVSSILAKYQRKLGHDVTVLARLSSDVLGITSFYEKPVDLRARSYVKMVLREAKNYDIIHIHDLPELILLLRLRYPRKKIVIHFHGKYSILFKRFVKFYILFANAIIVATPDLQQYLPKAHILPTIVDTDHFNGNPTSNKILAFTIRYLDQEKFRQHVGNVDIEIVDREKTPIPYSEMPAFLKQFGTYVDVKYFTHTNELLKAHSKTCFEALACGLNVIDWQGNVLKKLPENHKPEQIVRQCLEIYLQI